MHFFLSLFICVAFEEANTSPLRSLSRQNKIIKTPRLVLWWALARDAVWLRLICVCEVRNRHEGVTSDARCDVGERIGAHRLVIHRSATPNLPSLPMLHFHMMRMRWMKVCRRFEQQKSLHFAELLISDASLLAWAKPSLMYGTMALLCFSPARQFESPLLVGDICLQKSSSLDNFVASAKNNLYGQVYNLKGRSLLEIKYSGKSRISLQSPLLWKLSS